MKWFEGGIPQAIQAAKENKAVFIVFVTGEDEASTQMESYLHSESVTELCEKSKCVAVKLVSGSNDCKFFSQIFPLVVIPSTFLIGDNGTPLEVIGESKSAQDFLEKVRGAILLQNQSTQSQASESGGSGEQTSSGSSSSKSVEKKPSDKEMSRKNVNTEEAGAVGGASECGDEASPEKKARTEDLTLDEKVERAKELVKEKQEQKMVKESEDQKAKELERRKVGQGVQKLRQTQKEMDMLEAKKELKKDREEDKLARQRVKEQIARDRAEKNARFSEAKAERDKAAEEAKKQKLIEQQAAAEAESARRSQIARIQFRLPDGSSMTQQFPSTDTFASIHSYITGHMGCAITLSTSFPRRTFTEADHNTTLQDLSLAPSAVILVIPGSRGRSGVKSSSDGLAVTNILFSPFVFLWNILTSLFGFMSGSSSPSSSSSSSAAAQPSSLSAEVKGGDRNPGSARQRAAPSQGSGAIHRFHNAEDDEDDEDRATWNGNSTQQM